MGVDIDVLDSMFDVDSDEVYDMFNIQEDDSIDSTRVILETIDGIFFLGTWGIGLSATNRYAVGAC